MSFEGITAVLSAKRQILIAEIWDPNVYQQNDWKNFKINLTIYMNI